ncbi:SctD/MshK family protein [Qipengyuania qiaonensis]|uniref:YscD/Y4YQ C-terminal domain-containing protein n=1 Tax=Qipengyuania qiaonensis TaxID=2867240 RepID=A0ABS7J5Z3_9SPHN|nr:hypothetical protein [Qipengyuania qiaonensis]MBX7482755.1 hypothetical protein [Qipengyuania qiaonensis]
MNNPVPILDRTNDFVLRVFGGRLNGAQFTLPPGRLLTLGHGLDNDIVLRGTNTRGCRIELQTEDGRLRISLKAGEAHLLGQALQPDQPLLLPAFVPLALGEYRFAVGEDGHARWDEAEELAGQLVPFHASPPPVQSERMAPVEQARSRAYSLSRYIPGWAKHPAAMLLPALLLAFFLALGPIRDYTTRGLQGPESAKASLAAAGFIGVTVAPDPTGEFLVFSGAVADDIRLAELRKLVADKFPQARLDVDTNEALARAVTDILAAEGIDAEARAKGLGAVAIESEYLPVDRQVELEDRLKSDLPALRRVRFELTHTRGPNDLAYFFNSERYGLATYVNGNPGYLVTADGSHWFEGAVLPTGHEILSIRNGNISLRRNNQIERLLVDPGAASQVESAPETTSTQGENSAARAPTQPATTPIVNQGDRT